MTRRFPTARWFVYGRVPPPYGGVAIFTQRFVNRLRRRGSQVAVSDFRGKVGVTTALKAALSRPDLVLVNSLRWPILAIVVLLFPFSTRIAVDHNHSRALLGEEAAKRRSNALAIGLTRLCLRFFSRVWVVSPHLIDRQRQLSGRTPIRVVSPFLKPDEAERLPLVRAYAPEVRRLMERTGAASFVASAFRVVEENGRDLYGFTHLIEAVARLHDEGLDTNLFLFVGDGQPTPFLEKVQRLVDDLDLREQIAFQLGDGVLWPMLLHVEAYVRLTTTDGRSVAIEEALALGCPVIASDVVPRPDGCTLVSLDRPEELVDHMRAFAKSHGQERTTH